jgi:Cytochrome c oxidase caa3 assembly factor (Caa3_CtaG)
VCRGNRGADARGPADPALSSAENPVDGRVYAALLVTGQLVTLLLDASRNPLHTWVKRAVRSRVVTWLTWPPVGVIAYTVTIIGTPLTRLMSLVLTNPALHAAEHALYLAGCRPRPVRWPLRRSSRLTVEGERPIRSAIIRTPWPAACPRAISSRSAKLRQRPLRFLPRRGLTPPAASIQRAPFFR